MGLWMYLCGDCDHRTEKISTIAKKIIWCEKCGSIAKRIFCADGGGFKINGYNEKNGYSNKGEN